MVEIHNLQKNGCIISSEIFIKFVGLECCVREAERQIV